jgi:hypothetical protein
MALSPDPRSTADACEHEEHDRERENAEAE